MEFKVKVIISIMSKMESKIIRYYLKNSNEMIIQM